MYIHIIYVVSPYLVFLAFLVRLKGIHPFQINQKGYFKDNSLSKVGNDEYGHIDEPSRTFLVDKIFSVVQLLIFDFVEVFGHNKNLFRTLSNILGWSVLRILLPVKLIYYFCKMIHLRCLAGFWIGLCIGWRVERSLAQNILSQNKKS